MTWTQCIPQEVLDSIIEVVDDNPSALATYCTVSLQFCRASQRQVFRKIRLNPRYLPASIIRLNALISTNPRLATYIHVLEFVIPTGPLEDVDVIYTLLDKLTCVREVILEGGSWEALPEPLQARLLRIVRSSSALTLGDVYFPCNDLRSFSSVKRLQLLSGNSISYAPTESRDPSIRPEDVGYLESLELFSYRHAHEMLDVLGGTVNLTPLSLSRLQSCKLTLTMESAPHVQTLLDTCAEYIHNLHIQFYLSDPEEKPLNIQRLSHVQHLHLDSFDQKIHPVPWTCNVLRTLPPKNELSTLELSYSCLSDYDLDEWMSLDTLLTEERHAKLERVNLIINRNFIEDDLYRFFLKSMPRLSAKGILFFSVISPLAPAGDLGWKSIQVNGEPRVALATEKYRPCPRSPLNDKETCSVQRRPRSLSNFLFGRSFANVF